MDVRTYVQLTSFALLGWVLAYSARKLGSVVRQAVQRDALVMLRSLRDLNARSAAHGEATIDIDLHSGPVVAGSIGSPEFGTKPMGAVPLWAVRCA